MHHETSNSETSANSKMRLLVERIRGLGVIRSKDLASLGIPRAYLGRLVERGVLMRSGRGVYVPTETDLSESHSLAEVARRVPGGVVCLLSALRFHGLTTQNPFEVWVAVRRGRRRPRVDYPPLRVMWFSGKAYEEGIEEHSIEGVTVRIYGAAKTVADCFKYRNKVGLDVALEALRECRRQRCARMDEMYQYARICRMDRVMQPYLEALT